MLRKCFLKNTKLTYRYFCKEASIVTQKSVKPYEIAESEELDIQKIEHYQDPPKGEQKNKWDASIDMK